MQEVVYTSEGNVAQAMPAVIMLVVGIGLATLMQIFIGVMGGQLYQQTEADIDAISNTTTKNYIKSAINYSFKAQQTTAQYMSTLVLAAIISVALVLIFGAFSMLGFSFGGGYGRGYGGYGGVL